MIHRSPNLLKTMPLNALEIHQKSVGGRGFVQDPTGEAHNAPSDLLVVYCAPDPAGEADGAPLDHICQQVNFLRSFVHFNSTTHNSPKTNSWLRACVKTRV
jgi:hypothetical protein